MTAWSSRAICANASLRRVKQGDALFKVARIDTLYAEAEISERDVKEIIGQSHGEIAFVDAARKTKYPITIQIIEPAAVTKKDGNVFLVRMKLDRGAEDWWRPGHDRLVQNFHGKNARCIGSSRIAPWIFCG